MRHCFCCGLEKTHLRSRPTSLSALTDKVDVVRSRNQSTWRWTWAQLLVEGEMDPDILGLWRECDHVKNAMIQRVTVMGNSKQRVGGVACCYWCVFVLGWFRYALLATTVAKTKKSNGKAQKNFGEFFFFFRLLATDFSYFKPLARFNSNLKNPLSTNFLSFCLTISCFLAKPIWKTWH